jgi:phosphate starvation-inducible membrane PsiE
MMDLIRDLWFGDVPLVKTYWLFGVVVGIGFAIAFIYVEYQSAGLSTGFGPVFIIGLIVFYFIYVMFINIAIWRSANKYHGPRRYAILAKIMVVVSWSALIKEALDIYKVAPLG